MDTGILWAFAMSVVAVGLAPAGDCNGDGISDQAAFGPFVGASGGAWLDPTADSRLARTTTDFALAGGSFTVEAWVLRTVASGSEEVILFHGSESVNNGLFIGFRADQRFTFAFWGNDLDTAGAYPPDGQWHHWTCRFDALSGSREILRDGVVVASDIAPASFQGSGQIVLGGTAASRELNGVLDEVRVWLGVRSDALLAQDRFVQYGDGSIPADLLAYYRANATGANGATDLLLDLAGTNHLSPAHPSGQIPILTYETDCNGNGIPDSCDIAGGVSVDCDGNGVPDDCDIASGMTQDCNGNGVPDDCDVLFGVSEDCNGNGLPDECDLASGTSSDCNGNGVPDECDVASGLFEDCNGNGIPDQCDIANGTSLDSNADGFPDECDAVHNLSDGTRWSRLSLAIGHAAAGDEFMIQPGIHDWPGVVSKSVAVRGTDPDDPGVVSSTRIDFGTGGVSANGFGALRLSGLSFGGMRIAGENRNGGPGISMDRCRIDGQGIRGVVVSPRVTMDRCFVDGAARVLRTYLHGDVSNPAGDSSYLPRVLISNSVLRSVGAVVETRDDSGALPDHDLHGTSASMRNCLFVDVFRLYAPAPNLNGFEQLYVANCMVFECSPDVLVSGINDVSIEATLVEPDPSVFADHDGPDNDPFTGADNDYRHAPGSPAIDAGDDTLVASDFFDADGDGVTFQEPAPYDLDGNPRFAGTVDLGPYEFQGPAPCNTADLADPFGLLDLADISVFIAGFMNQQPVADLDENGIFDLSDVTMFVTAFLAGCP